MKVFNDSIFAENHLSFGHLLAHEEELAIWRRKPTSVRLSTYRRDAPTIYAAAQRLHGQIHLPQKWGKVGRHNDWTTVEAGVWYQNARFRYRGERMGLLDVCKMLVGKTKAIGSTDAPLAQSRKSGTGWEYNLVTCLRLDVDMESPWRQHRLDAVAEQIQTERRCAQSLGLPYRCFRTGGKGHQIVVPLPVPTPHLLAWWWLTALKTLIENHRHPDATLDKDNLTSLLRLPGGLHQNGTRLALWINPDTMRLHDISAQATLMQDGFCYPDEDDLAYIPPREFYGAGKEMLRVMEKEGMAKHHVPGNDRRDLFLRPVRELPVNAGVRVFLHALDIAASKQEEQEACKIVAELGREKADAALFSGAAQGKGFDVAWARRVVEKGFVPGGFWEWLSMDGKRGILALWLVCGETAEQEAIAMAERVPCRSEAERRKRIRTIKSYWHHFRIKGSDENFSAAPARIRNEQVFTGELTSESLALAASLGQALKGAGKVQARNLPALENAVHVVLLALEQSPNGHIQISAQALADTLCRRWPGTTIARKDADRLLSWLTQDDAEKYAAGEAPSKNKPSCKIALLQLVRDTFGDKYGNRIVANEYRPGATLVATPLGQSLKAKRRGFRRQYLSASNSD